MTTQNAAYDEKTSHTLYTRVEHFYQDLLEHLKTAERTISIMYYAFDYGHWTTKISQVLKEKATDGVKVRLMVDEFGMVLDEPRHALSVSRGCLVAIPV